MSSFSEAFRRSAVCLALLAVPFHSMVVAQSSALTIDQIAWLDQVKWIILPAEISAFEKLDSQTDRQDFIAEFWRKRDPTPDTPLNEILLEHYRRLELAIRELGEGRPGWDTDRGRVLIVQGIPDRRYRTAEYEVWAYTSSSPARANLEPFVVIFRYSDPAGKTPLVPFGALQGGPWGGEIGPGTANSSIRRYISDLSAPVPATVHYHLVNAGPVDNYIDPKTSVLYAASLKRLFRVRRKLIHAILQPLAVR